MPGSATYEPKFDGFRMIMIRDGDGVRLWSRSRRELSDRFPDLVRAGRFLPVGTVLDGEAVTWDGDHLSFDRLQMRNQVGPRRIAATALEWPAHYVVFDLLAAHYEDLRGHPLSERRARLADLRVWRPPLQLSPWTDDHAQAQEWLTEPWHDAGIEGVVSKGAGDPYRAGTPPVWVKTKSRGSEDVIVGAVLGKAARPTHFLAGLYVDATLVIVGRSGLLNASQSAVLGQVLRPPVSQHPWPDRVSSGRYGGAAVAITKVEPVVVVEVLADAARDASGWRHQLRFVRIRSDLLPADLPPYV